MASSCTSSQCKPFRIGLLCVSIASLVFHIVAFFSPNWLSVEMVIPVITPNTIAPVSVTVDYRWGPWTLCAAEYLPANLTNYSKGIALDMCFSIKMLTDITSSESRKEGLNVLPQNSPPTLLGNVGFIQWTQALGVLSIVAFAPVPVQLILSIVRRSQYVRCCLLDSICVGLSVVACLLLVGEVSVFWLHMASVSSAFDVEVKVYAGKWAYAWGIYSEAVCANFFAMVAILELVLAARVRPDDHSKAESNRKGGRYTGYRYKQMRDAEVMPNSDI